MKLLLEQDYLLVVLFLHQPLQFKQLLQTLGVVQGGTLPGSSAGTTPASGYIGNSLTANAQAVSVGTSLVNVTSLSIPAGIWLISSCLNWQAGSSNYGYVLAYLSTNSAAAPTSSLVPQNTIYSQSNSTIPNMAITFPTQQMIFTTTTTLYLVSQTQNGPSYPGAYGQINAILIG